MSALPHLDFAPGAAKLPPKLASLRGFRSGERGTQTSRTIMLDELSQLLDAVSGEASRRDYADAVIDDNCLGKRTAATRKGQDAARIALRVSSTRRPSAVR